MLKKIRVALEAIFFIGITFLFLGIGYDWWGWMATIQFGPSIMRVVVSATALNIGILAALVVITFIFGRLYCSLICPLGALQDSIIWLRRKIRRQKFSYSEKFKWLRGLTLAVFIVSFFTGAQVVVALLAPYSAYGRFIVALTGPRGGIALIAAVSFAIVIVLSIFSGRFLCTSVCPIGTILAFIGRHPLFGIRIDEGKCVECGMCGKKCKASAIDTASKKVNYMRCIDCFDCIDNCSSGAISYGPLARRKRNAGVDNGRRAFLVGSAIAVGSLTLKAEENKVDGGLAAIEKKKRPERTGPIVPAGAFSTAHFYNTCTACQLCVAACPFGVLVPSTHDGHLMQPELDFTRDYCHTGCTRCSEVCPTGAIVKITPEDKAGVHIGRAKVSYDLCLAAEGEERCGNCLRHCPSGAIRMVPKDPSNPSSPKIPVVLEEKCTGCGACEHVCPSRPFSAIHVNGLSVHIKD